jgi:HIV Tat-specific factor 1
LLSISPYDQQPRIKIYLEPNSKVCKGDASLCFNAEESVKLALDILNGGYIRPNFKISVTRATFESTTKSVDPPIKSSLSQAQLKVARNAARQALTWNEVDDAGISKTSALRIVVLEGMFRPDEFSVLNFEEELEHDVASECEKFGTIEKITIFSKNPRGIIIVKFSTAFAAQDCIKVMNGRFFGAVKIKSYFWDGSTNYSMSIQQAEAEEKEEESRLDDLGVWLDENQKELPDEFRLRVES